MDCEERRVLRRTTDDEERDRLRGWGARAARGGPGPDSGATSRPPELYLPLDSAAEAALVPGVTVFG
ncbi:hypothetical protein QZN07_07035, partial [Burkholderia cenocepacia]|nr:hypothetical protein [Burkholderia cenocepacia]